MGPDGAHAFLCLSDTTTHRPPDLPVVDNSGGDVRVSMEYGEPVSAAGLAQGLAWEVEKGRVVLGESGMLRAHMTAKGHPVGMNYPGYDNRHNLPGRLSKH